MTKNVAKNVSFAPFCCEVIASNVFSNIVLLIFGFIFSSGDYQVKLRDIVSGFWGPSKLENAVSRFEQF